MASDNDFDSVAKQFGFEGVNAASFSRALDAAVKKRGRVYFTEKGFQSGKELKFYEKWRGIKIPKETVLKLAATINPTADAGTLQQSVFESLGTTTEVSEEIQKKSVRIYRVFNAFAKKDNAGEPKFLHVVRNEDLGKVRKAVNSILASPHEQVRMDELLYDKNGQNPLHALALNPHLEGRSIDGYMAALKKLDPNAEGLWLKPDKSGVTPLALAASELNFAVFNYVINSSGLARERVIASGPNIVVELLIRHTSETISSQLKESGKVNNSFEIKQRIRRMLVAALEAYPELAEKPQVTHFLRNRDMAEDIRYVVENAQTLAAKARERTQKLESWKQDCAAFEELLQQPGSPDEKVEKVNHRIDDIKTILAKQPCHLRGINERNSEGLTLLQQKVKEGDIDFVRDLCDPLRSYDHFVDFSNDTLMKTTAGKHLLELAQESPQHSEEMFKLLLSKAPELARNVPLAKDYNAAELAVEKDQLLKTEGLRQAIFQKHLAYLQEIKPVLEAEKLGVTTHLESSPTLTHQAERYEAPEEKQIIELLGFVISRGKLVKALFSAASTKVKALFAGIANQQKGQKYEAEALRTLSAIPQEIAQQKLFEGRVIHVAANIGSREVVNTAQDQQAAAELYRAFVEKNRAIHVTAEDNQGFKTMPWGKLESKTEGWKGIITTGVCWGTVMDIIERFSDKGFSQLEQIAEVYRKGSPDSACANQALYHALAPFPTHPVQVVFDSLALLNRLNGMEKAAQKGLFNADFTCVQKLFAKIMANEVRKTEDVNFQRENKEKDALDLEKKSDEISSTHPLIQMCLERLKDMPLMDDTGKNSVEQFFINLRSDWQGYIDKNATSPNDWAAGLNTIIWLEGLLMQQVGWRDFYQEVSGKKERTTNPRFDSIPDKRLRAFLAEVDTIQESNYLESKVIGMRNLTQALVQGLPERYIAATDVNYLRRFKHLPNGAYVISYSTHSFQADCAHSIAYFKEGEEGYIFDPNVGLIRCRQGQHAEDLLQLLSVYKIPKGKSSHDMEIRKVERKHNALKTPVE